MTNKISATFIRRRFQDSVKEQDSDYYAGGMHEAIHYEDYMLDCTPAPGQQPNNDLGDWAEINAFGSNITGERDVASLIAQGTNSVIFGSFSEQDIVRYFGRNDNVSNKGKLKDGKYVNKSGKKQKRNTTKKKGKGATKKGGAKQQSHQNVRFL